jgi:hypothetical protein
MSRPIAARADDAGSSSGCGSGFADGTAFAAADGANVAITAPREPPECA